jgi:two-component system chemotaxis response regulator CheB
MRIVPFRRKRLVREVAKTSPLPEVQERGKVVRDIVAIGVSTGGPPAVQKILSELPADFPACILIAQHMPKTFTGPFAKRLNEASALDVKEAESGDVIKPGRVFVSPGGSHLKIKQQVTHIDVVVDSEPADALYKPSANELIASVAQAVGRRGLGVILTGMGSDGREGIRQLKERGGFALAQSNETCVVYGMPKAIVDAGLADRIVDLDEMPAAILRALY